MCKAKGNSFAVIDQLERVVTNTNEIVIIKLDRKHKFYLEECPVLEESSASLIFFEIIQLCLLLFILF